MVTSFFDRLSALQYRSLNQNPHLSSKSNFRKVYFGSLHLRRSTEQRSPRTFHLAVCNGHLIYHLGSFLIDLPSKILIFGSQNLPFGCLQRSPNLHLRTMKSVWINGMRCIPYLGEGGSESRRNLQNVQFTRNLTLDIHPHGHRFVSKRNTATCGWNRRLVNHSRQSLHAK